MAWLMKRGSVYYIRYCIGSKKRKVSTDTENFQLAKEKLRQFEAAQARGDLSPLPTRTPIADVLTAYVAHIRATKTAKSAQTDVYSLRWTLLTSGALSSACDDAQSRAQVHPFRTCGVRPHSDSVRSG
jgi:hypothetical protein